MVGVDVNQSVVYRPTADILASAGAAISARLSDFSGATIGLLWNSKANADVYLRRLEVLLAERHENMSFVWRRKPSSSKPMQDDDAAALRDCDAVVTAFGD